MSSGVTLVGLLDASRLEEHLQNLKQDKTLRPRADELIKAFAELALGKQNKQAEVLLSLAGRVAARLGMALEDMEVLMAPSQLIPLLRQVRKLEPDNKMLDCTLHRAILRSVVHGGAPDGWEEPGGGGAPAASAAVLLTFLQAAGGGTEGEWFFNSGQLLEAEQLFRSSLDLHRRFLQGSKEGAGGDGGEDAATADRFKHLCRVDPARLHGLALSLRMLRLAQPVVPPTPGDIGKTLPRHLEDTPSQEPKATPEAGLAGAEAGPSGSVRPAAQRRAAEDTRLEDVPGVGDAGGASGSARPSASMVLAGELAGRLEQLLHLDNALCLAASE
ncbi:hypothetical protein T484DRAFT_1907902, partial [Baffinella frigidus]